MIEQHGAVLLAAEAITRSYPASRAAAAGSAARVSAVNAVTLRIAAGERVGLVGASGSGKSTLLRVLLALEEPDSGQIRCGGRPVRPDRVSRLRWFRRQVQYIPQDPGSSLDPRHSVERLLGEPLRRLGIDGDRPARIREVLDAVGLAPDLLRRRPGELSGGQCQRVAIARAIATRPRMLIADEPVSGLDLPLRRQVVTMLGDLAGRDALAILLVSHDISVVAELCERCCVMTGGRLVEDRPTADVLSTPGHEHTRQLLSSIPRLPAG